MLTAATRAVKQAAFRFGMNNPKATVAGAKMNFALPGGRRRFFKATLKPGRLLRKRGVGAKQYATGLRQMGLGGRRK